MTAPPRQDSHPPPGLPSLPTPIGDPPWKVAHGTAPQASDHSGTFPAPDQQPLGIIAAAERLRLQHLLDPVPMPSPPIRLAKRLALGRSLHFAVRTTALALFTALVLIYLVRPEGSPGNHAAAPQGPRPALPPPPAKPPPPRPRADPADIAVLVRRGEAFLASNDVISARLVLDRAADAGDANAAFLMGESYDAAALEERGITGVPPDPVKARAWYQTSARLGDVRASQRLRRLDVLPGR